MKKILLASAIALFGLANAQEKGNFSIGAHIGLPTGDIAESHNFNFGVDVAYLHPVAENFKLGVTTGYSHYNGKSIEESAFGYSVSYKVPGFGVIPVAATAQYTFEGANVFIGADLGYGFLTGKLTEGTTGGFYYQPKVGYTFAEKHNVALSYKGISVEGGTVGSVNLGYGFNF